MSETQKQSEDGLCLVAGLMMGMLIGAGAVMLFGSEQTKTASLERIRRAALRLGERAEQMVERVRSATRQVIESKLSDLEAAIEAGKQAADERLREMEARISVDGEQT